MIKLFSSTVFQVLKSSSRVTRFYQLYYFSTHTAFNWDQHFPYTSRLNETSFQTVAPNLKNFPKDVLSHCEDVFKQYLANKDPTLLSEKDAKTLAMIVWKMGSFAQIARNDPEAEAYYLEALDISKKMKSPSMETVAMIQNNLGWLYYHMNELDKALICLENVASIIESTPNFHDFDGMRVRNLYFTSNVLKDQGKEDQAIRILNKLITILESDSNAPPNSSLTALAYTDLGLLYQSKNLQEEAFEVWEEGIRFIKHLYGKDTDDLQHLYRSLGEAYLIKENDIKCVENMKKCIRICMKYDKINFNDFYVLSTAQFQLRDHEGCLENAQKFLDLTGSGLELEKKASVYQMMSVVHYMNTNITLAEKAFSSLITILSSLYGEGSVQIADALMERVNLLADQEVAKHYYRIALEDAINFCKNHHNLDPTRKVNLLLRIGESYANDEDWSQALKYFEEIQTYALEKYLPSQELEYINVITSKAYCKQGRLEEGLIYAEKGKALCEAAGDPYNKLSDLNKSIHQIHKLINKS